MTAREMEMTESHGTIGSRHRYEALASELSASRTQHTSVSSSCAASCAEFGVIPGAMVAQFEARRPD